MTVAGTHFSDLNIRSAKIAGGAAGDFTLTGISKNSRNTPEDKLLAVFYIASTLANSADLTSEFSVTADDTINNTGGTTTTGGVLFVLWLDQDY